MRILYSFVFTFLFLANSWSQNCYQVIDDLSGDLTDLNNLESASCSLIDSLPSNYQSNFKVLSASFYLHNSNMNIGLEEHMSNYKIKANALSQNYLLIIRQISIDNKITYKMELKLPSDWLSNCFDNLSINSLQNSFKSKLSQLQRNYNSVNDREILETELIDYIAVQLGKLASCCSPGIQRNTACSFCISAFDVLNWLELNNFEPYDGGTVSNSDPQIDQNCLCDNASVTNNNSSSRSTNLIVDYANLNFVIDNITYDLTEVLEEWSDLGLKAFITKNSNFCTSNLFDDIDANFDSNQGVIWVHIWENPKPDNMDVIFIKVKFPVQAEPNFPEFAPEIPESNSVSNYEYKIVHRTFAPWDRFGHLPALIGPGFCKNSFAGDNRGFSLGETNIYNAPTSRIHQSITFELKNKILGEPKLFSSITRGFSNFNCRKPKRLIPNPYKEELDRWEYVPSSVEETAICNPGGWAAVNVDGNTTYTYMQFSGADPLIKLPMIAPDIAWFLRTAIFYKESNKSINVKGLLIGKSFPAYEAYIEDKCGNKVFLHTYASPCESELAKNLLNHVPLFFLNEEFLLTFIINDVGCFSGSMSYFLAGINTTLSLHDWNNIHLNKQPAKDCLIIPCQGAFPNDGTDKRHIYECSSN